MQTNKKTVIWVVVTSLVLGLLTVSLQHSTAQTAPSPKSESATQKAVRVRADGSSFLLTGDPLIGTDKALDGGAIPFLLQQGWRIAQVHMTASAGVNPEQHAAFFVLEKK